MGPELRIAVVGAGMAGLVSARQLADAGHDVTLLDKSRGLGGRLASRRTPHGPLDHGARFISPRTPAFSNFLDVSSTNGVAACWAISRSESARRFVGLPTMNGLVKPLAAGIRTQLQSHVTRISRSRDGWRLQIDDELSKAVFDRIILAVPAPQAAALLRDAGDAFSPLENVRMSPRWTYLAVFERPLQGATDLPASEDTRVEWVARDSAKPGRTGDTDRWILHASAEWTRNHLELAPETILPELRELFARAVGRPLPPALYESAHRWRFALTDRALGLPFLSDPESTLFACGDWCLGDTAEDAFRSGSAVAEALLERDGHPDGSMRSPPRTTAEG